VVAYAGYQSGDVGGAIAKQIEEAIGPGGVRTGKPLPNLRYLSNKMTRYFALKGSKGAGFVQITSNVPCHYHCTFSFILL
jgi:hypothetical protein